jgi:hypothetical protein
MVLIGLDVHEWWPSEQFRHLDAALGSTGGTQQGRFKVGLIM